MGFFDSFKQMVSDKLDDVLGEEPKPKKSEQEAVATPVLESESELVINEEAYADYSQIHDGAITKIVGGVTVEEEDEEVEIEDEVSNVDVNPLLNVEKIPTDLNPVNMIEEQCSCKVFFRNNVPAKVYDDMERMHTVIDKSNPGVSVEIATRCASADDNNEDKVFVGLSRTDGKVYNFIYSGSLSGSRLVEFQMYLVTLIGRCNLSQIFYVQGSVRELEDRDSLNYVPLLIHTKDNRVLWNTVIGKYEPRMKEIGQVLDLSDEKASDGINTNNEELRAMLEFNLNGTLYPNSHRFFVINSEVMLQLSFLSYIDGDSVRDVAKYIESIHRLVKESEG